MIRARRARIVATLGPASSWPNTILALATAGVDVFRLNFSHGAHEDHKKTVEAVRSAETILDRPIALLADLQGPKFRVGKFAEGKATLEPGQVFRMELDGPPGDANRVTLPHPEIFAALSHGARVLVDDGKIRMRVEDHGDTYANMRVIEGGVISDRKGVNLPGAIIPMSALTEKDKADLAFALDCGVDWVGLSFVQKPEDMMELHELVQGRASVLAKIEKPQALETLPAILDLCDGVMVARGDLGVELAPEEVPVVQKTIIRAARTRGIPVIVATQMLDSMIKSATPTRAEASDCANAVYEGADALMLSGETAAGAYPLEAVAMMDRIISRVERDPLWPDLMAAQHFDSAEDAAAIAVAAWRAAVAVKAACIVAFSSRGATARRVSRERPLQGILALTPSLASARRLALGWGLEARIANDPNSVEDMTDQAVKKAVDLGLAAPGDRVVIVAGVPFGMAGSTNLIRIAHVPD